MATNPKVLVGGKMAAVDGDMVLSMCGHNGTITATSKVKITNKSAAKVGDSFSGDFTGYIVTGYPTMNIP